MIEQYIQVALIGLLYGYFEQHMNRGRKFVTGYWFFEHRLIKGHFSWYHVWMLAFFLLISPHWKFLPLIILIADMAWFLFHPKDELDPSDWVNWNLGGFRIIKRWVPWVYVLLLSLFIILELLF